MSTLRMRAYAEAGIPGSSLYGIYRFNRRTHRRVMINEHMGIRMISAVMAAFLLSVPAQAGVPLAGMGGVGTGIATATGDIADNPAASSSGLRRHEGAFSAGASWLRLGFSGYGINTAEKTTSWFQSGSGLSWGMVTPMLGAGRGRLALGSWQLERRVLDLDESLDLSMASSPGGSALSTQYFSGLSRLKQDEFLYAHGFSWVQTVLGGDHTVAVGAALLEYGSSESLEVTGDSLTEKDVVTGLRRISRRSEMLGPGIMLGWHYRPVPGGSIGARLLYAGKMTGRTWEQVDGGPVRDDGISRGPQPRLSVGGSFILFDAMTAALDMNYCGGIQADKTLFAGTAQERKYREKSDAIFSVSAGAEYLFRMKRADLPLRLGFFSRPDGMPSVVSGTLPPASVQQLVPAPFRQDLMGITAGTGLETGPLRVDIALAWLMVDTRVMVPGPAGYVEEGDVRSSVGAYLSFSSRFGGNNE